ncbi:unnamed protein product [Lymnaea stagnalis]|uniref:UDP-glucuronosyltransferase n=1 Tax=Lymnaea stagnalis TaxID=6523 RepID=A0AAV2IHK1_LYMST
MSTPRGTLALLSAVSVLLLGRLPGSGAKTVVMFPPAGRSYILYHANIAEALIELGHDVWICVTDYLAQQGLVKNPSVKVLVYGRAIGNIEARFQSAVPVLDDFWEGRTRGLLDSSPMTKLVNQITQEMLLDEGLVSQLRNLKPDLFVLEEGPMSTNMIVLPYKLGIPYALIGTMNDMLLTRTPFSPGAEPMVFMGYTNRMTFLQRVHSTLMYLMFTVYNPFISDELVTRFAPEKPHLTLRELVLRAEVYVFEVDHILDYPRPSMPNVKHVGGSSATISKPLTGDFKQFVEASVNGIAVVTFGGNEIGIPGHILKRMSEAFQKLDINVIWKANMTSPDPTRIMTSNWVPQNDLLGHPKTRVFVSHCGKNGQYEALYHAVPILCLPIYGDQYYNTERIRSKGFGLGADIRKITSEDLVHLIKEIASEAKYKTTIQKASKLFKELYQLPMKKAAYWFDHVMKYGGDYMRSSGQEMPLYQFLLLDVMAFLTVVTSCLFLLIFLVFRFIERRLLNRKHTPKSKQQ